jgi:hypothetical protein
LHPFTFPVRFVIDTAVQATQAELVKASSETESCRQTIESLLKEVSEVKASPPHQCLSFATHDVRVVLCKQGLIHA